MSERHWRNSRPRMADLRADRRAVGLVETTVWVPAGRTAEIREWAWGWCEEHIDATGQRSAYERQHRESLDRDAEERVATLRRKRSGGA